MKMMSRSILVKLTQYLSLLVFLQMGSAAADSPLLYRIARTETLVVTDFDGESISWENPVLVELQATIDPIWETWQTLAFLEGSQPSGSAAVPRPVSPIPARTALVGISPAILGDSFDEGSEHERPTRPPATEPFFIDRYVVTCSVFSDVFQWAYDNGRIQVASNVVWNLEGDPQPRSVRQIKVKHPAREDK